MKAPKAPKTNPAQVVVLWTNQPAINQMEAKLNDLMPLAQKLSATYFQTPFHKPEATISHILTQARDEARAHFLSLIPESIEMGTLRIDKTAAIKSGLFAQPSFIEFEQALNTANETDLQQLSPFFKIEDGLCILNSQTWNTFVTGQSITAQSPAELEMFEKWQNFLDSVQDFDKFLRKNCDVILLNGLSLTQFSRFAVQDNEAKLKINAQVFEALSKKLKILYKG